MWSRFPGGRDLGHIVGFWSPATTAARADCCTLPGSLLVRENPVTVDLARVFAHGPVSAASSAATAYFSLALRRGFRGRRTSGLGENARLVPIISASRGRVESLGASAARDQGYRAMFDLALTETASSRSTCGCFCRPMDSPCPKTWLTSTHRRRLPCADYDGRRVATRESVRHPPGTTYHTRSDQADDADEQDAVP